MTDETEAVIAQLFCKLACDVPGAWPSYLDDAKELITALDNHRIERAGEVEQRLLDHGHMTQRDGLQALLVTGTAAAATIAALKAQIERLTEREAPYATKADSDGDDGA